MDKEKILNSEDINIYLKYRLLVNLTILSFFLFFHCFWSGAIYFAFALMVLFILFDNLENGLTYIVFYFPFSMISIFECVVLFCVLFALFMVKYVVKTYFLGKTKIDWKFLVLVLAFLVYCLIPIGPYTNNTLAHILPCLGVFFALLMAIKNNVKIRFNFNAKVLALALIISSVMALTSFFDVYISHHLMNYDGRFTALFNHPNVLAMLCEIVSAFLVYYILSNRAGKVEIVLLVALTVFGAMSLSKTFLILMGIEYLSLLIYFFQKSWKKALIVVLGLLCAGVILWIIGHDWILRYFERFFNGEKHFETFKDFLNVITTYRYELWEVYFNESITNPLILFFGAGVGAMPIGPRGISAHNMFISMVYQLGICGCLLLVLILVYSFIKIQRTKGIKVSKAICVPAIVLGLICFVEDLIFFMYGH